MSSPTTSGSITNLKRHSGSINFGNNSEIGFKCPRTSTSHPLNISWILNELDQKRVNDTEKRQKIPQKQLKNSVINTHLREEFGVEEFMGISSKPPKLNLQHGNFALSSCPGKKVRLATGPTRGKAMISRDLDLDFQRIAGFNIKTVIW
ncbi:hypothetical protein HDV06_001456 [Boothiomyces sp. JEL0866]|nr:hypothetical protein HDV06_001456 [Boothiomyces sp. JEL0866]